MRSCVGFVGGNGNRRRTKSAERRQPPKTEKRISWNLNQRGETANSSPCTVQLSPVPDDNSISPKPDQQRRIPPPTPPNPYVLSPYFNYYEAGRLSPNQPQQQQSYSRSTPPSPTPSRKLPITPIFEHSVLSPEYR